MIKATIAVEVRRAHRANGRKTFHVNIISWSYRMRGSEARTMMNKVAINSPIILSPSGWAMVGSAGAINSLAVSRLVSRMLVYSAINKSAKPPLAYSTLKPETNSDSPSTKSKGAR